MALALGVPAVYYAREQLREVRKPAALPSARTPVEMNALQRIQAGQPLRVGCLWYPPFVDYTTESGAVNAYGLYPTILASLATSEHVQISYSVLKWHEAIESLERREVDVVACVLKSAERRSRCDFAGTIFRVGVGAVVRRGQSKIKDHGDLARLDVSIAVTKGEIGWTYARDDLELDASDSRLTVLEDKKIQTMMSLVATGDVDCALGDSLSCAQFIQSSGMVGTLEDVFASNPIHVEDNCLMVAKGSPEFREWLAAGVQRIRAAPAIRHLEQTIEMRYRGVLRRSGAPA